MELSAGYAWNDNVGLDELERATGESDKILTLQAQVAGSLDISERTSVRFTAGITDQKYSVFTKVDRGTKTLGVNLESELDKATIGINWFSADAKLDGKQFLTYERLSPYMSGFLSKRWFLRGEYIYGEKQLVSRPGRSSSIHSVAADNYFFIQGLKRYLVLGYAYRLDNSRADRYEYESHAIKARYLQLTKISDLPIELQLEVKLEDRHYQGTEPFIQKRRKDLRTRFSAELTFTLSKMLSVAMLIKNADYNSNLSTASYSDLMIGTEFRIKF